MVRLTQTIDWVECADDLEVAVRHARLVREHRPRFNPETATWKSRAYVKVDAREPDHGRAQRSKDTRRRATWGRSPTPPPRAAVQSAVARSLDAHARTDRPRRDRHRARRPPRRARRHRGLRDRRRSPRRARRARSAGRARRAPPTSLRADVPPRADDERRRDVPSAAACASATTPPGPRPRSDRTGGARRAGGRRRLARARGHRRPRANARLSERKPTGRSRPSARLLPGRRTPNRLAQCGGGAAPTQEETSRLGMRRGRGVAAAPAGDRLSAVAGAGAGLGAGPVGEAAERPRAGASHRGSRGPARARASGLRGDGARPLGRGPHRAGVLALLPATAAHR